MNLKWLENDQKSDQTLPKNDQKKSLKMTKKWPKNDQQNDQKWQ